MTPKVPPGDLVQQQCPFFTFSLKLAAHFRTVGNIADVIVAKLLHLYS